MPILQEKIMEIIQSQNSLGICIYTGLYMRTPNTYTLLCPESVSWSLEAVPLIIIGLMIRRGDPDRGEGATCWGIATRIDTRRRRRVDGSVYTAAVLFLSVHRKNVTIAFHGPLLPGSSSGVPALLAARVRDIGIARDKPDGSNLAISFGKTRRERSPRSAAKSPPATPKNRSSTKGHDAQKDANSTRCGPGLRRILRRNEKHFVIRGKFIIVSIFITRRAAYLSATVIRSAKDLTRDRAVIARLRWFLAVMPSSEEESQWLVGSGGGLAPSGGSATKASAGERVLNTRTGLYTEEMTTQPTSVATAGVNSTSADSAEHDLIDSTADATLLAQFHEDAIKQAGVGYFQILAAFCTGLSLAADTVEFFVVPYILPSAEVELCIEDNEKGWLGNITLIGLALGGLFWGGLGDRLGRRRSLLSAMSVHALFSGVATFMPTYGTFMTARFCSALGVGGAVPLAFAYLAECCPRLSRGRWIGILVAAGALGGVYAALLAWAVVPTTGEMVVLENKEHFSAWHRFLLLCCLPALCSTFGLIFLPESPRYLVEAGRDVEAMMVYQRIYKKNNARKSATGTQYQLSELELPTKRPRGLAPPSPSNHTSVLADIIYSIEMFWNSFLELFTAPHLHVTLILLIIWSAASFSIYGLMIWCPEYLKLLRAMEYEAHTEHFQRLEFNDTTFTGSWENRQYKDSTFFNCRFTKMIFSHVDFDNCTFQSVEFSSIKSSKTHFRDSVIVYSKFVDTDLSAQVFTRCKLENNTELSLSGPCPTLDLDYNIYIEEALHAHLVAQLAFVPAAALAGLALTVLQRPKLIGFSLFFSSVAALCLILIHRNSSAVLGFEGGFTALFAVAWTSLTLVTVESFPTHLRCTGFGLIAAAIRISGLIGTTTYQTLLDVSLIAPALLTALVLLIASAATFKLPHTHTVFL